MANDNGQASFRRSTFSAGSGNCVEVAFEVGGSVAVRHSRMPRLTLRFSAGEWDAFLEGVKDGQFDRPAPDI